MARCGVLWDQPAGTRPVYRAAILSGTAKGVTPVLRLPLVWHARLAGKDGVFGCFVRIRNYLFRWKPAKTHRLSPPNPRIWLSVVSNSVSTRGHRTVTTSKVQKCKRYHRGGHNVEIDFKIRTDPRGHCQRGRLTGHLAPRGIVARMRQP